MAKTPTKTTKPGDVNTPVQDETKYGEQITALEGRIAALERAQEDGKLDASNYVKVSALDGLVSKDTLDDTVREVNERVGSELQSLADKVTELREAQTKATRDGPHRDVSTLPRTEDL